MQNLGHIRLPEGRTDGIRIMRIIDLECSTSIEEFRWGFISLA